MPRQPALVFALIGSVLLSSACRQHSKEDDPPPTAAATAAPVPVPSAAPTPDPIPPPVDPIPPPTPPPAAPAAAAVKAESIKACCTALHKEGETTAAAKDKSLYQSAAASCDAISKLVSSGTTKKAAALTQLRANLRGAKLPAGCD